MKVYNTKLLKNKQRFLIAILIGALCAIGCALIFAFFQKMIGIHIPLLYVAIAYAIAMAIKTFGKGVEQKFSIVGAICCAISIFLANFLYLVITIGFNFELFPYYMRMTIATMSTLDVHGIMEMLCIAYAVYVAYYYARIV